MIFRQMSLFYFTKTVIKSLLSFDSRLSLITRKLGGIATKPSLFRPLSVLASRYRTSETFVRQLVLSLL